MNAVRLLPKSIADIFKLSGKKHLVITGSISSGKTTLAKACAEILCGEDKENITTYAEPKKCVFFESSFGDKFIAAEYDKNAAGEKCKMKAVSFAFSENGVNVLEKCIKSDKKWVVIDEIGYVESGVVEYETALKNLFSKKRVIAVLRKQDTPFSAQILNMADAFVYDLDKPVKNICCAVMASGQSKRYGKENKLLADFCGSPLVSFALKTAKNQVFSDCFAVTVHREIAELCERNDMKYILHSFEKKSDAIKLAVKEGRDFDGIMFLNSDQPLVSRESIEKLVLAFSNFDDCIVRLGYGEIESSPVIFPKSVYETLLNLPENERGIYAVHNSGLKTVLVTAENELEIFDVDSKDDLQTLSNAVKKHDSI